MKVETIIRMIELYGQYRVNEVHGNRDNWVALSNVSRKQLDRIRKELDAYQAH